MICPICAQVGFTYVMAKDDPNEEEMRAVQCACGRLTVFASETGAVSVFRPGDGTYLRWDNERLSTGDDVLDTRKEVDPLDTEAAISKSVDAARVTDVMGT